MKLISCVLLTALLTVLGCVEKSEFQCQLDQQCTNEGVLGKCQENRLCSYPDESGECASGYAYSESAGSLSGTCVEEIVIPPGCESPTVDLSMGNSHSCLLTAAGEVYCWGNNASGQLGLDTQVPTSSPSQVHIANISQLDVGGEHSCALEASGHVWCWGRNSSSQLGNRTSTMSTRPVLVTGIDNAIDISAGQFHSCAVLADDHVVCWGSNSNSQLGGGSAASGIRSDIPVTVVASPNAEPLTGARMVVAGLDHSCAATDDAVYCWGLNVKGELGDGTTSIRAFPVQVSGLPRDSKVEELSAGDGFTCARTSAEELYCWGTNLRGQLGSETMATSVPKATKVAFSGVTAISSMRSHSCAIVSGEVQCWGGNANGQLGDNSLEDRGLPTLALSDALLVAAGGQHSCGITSAGSLTCWGSGRSGQLASGDVVHSSEPVAVLLPEDSPAEHIVAGTEHSCVVQAGKVYCWGQNSVMQLGLSNLSDAVSTPASLMTIDGEELSGVSRLTARKDATCSSAETADSESDGATYCWGAHPSLLGTTSPQSIVPLPTRLNGDVQSVSVGENRMFTQDSARDSVRCWGTNGNGECGIPDSTTSTDVPRTSTQFSAEGPTDQVILGRSHSCALIDSAVYCVGRNTNAALGDLTSSTTEGMTIALVPLSGAATQIVSLGSFSSCALLSDKTVECWGLNTSGQLGDGTLSSGSPRKANIDQVETLVGGVESGCAIRSDQSVWCWGQSTLDLFKTGVATFSITPVLVTPGPVKEIALGRSHLCTINSDDDRVYCIGNNLDGNLGNGRDLGNVLTPATTVIQCE